VTELKRHYVPSGGFFVGKTQPLVLKAILGTCVGVAVYDPRAGVGGLVHLLLPEPLSPGAEHLQEAKYACTGLPAFLAALDDAGADRRRLRAVLAGGALIAPVNDLDLRLDIGGRTVEVVQNILAQEKIPVEQSDTGGLWPSNLMLDMTTWESRIKPAGTEMTASCAAPPAPAAGELSAVINKLAPIPQIALKVMRMIDADTYDIKALSDEVRKDQVISARTLKVCNAALLARRQPVDSIDDALVLLGQNLFLQLVLSVNVRNFFNQIGMGYSLCKGGLFHHAVGTAMIAERVARATGAEKPARAYTAGLLHDIGKIVLDQFITATCPMFYRLHNTEKDILDIENQVLKTDHTAVGFQLARMWAFPDALADTIRHHHRPEEARCATALAHTVYLADVIMSRFHADLEIELPNTQRFRERLETLGMSASGVLALIDDIPHQVLGGVPDLGTLPAAG
jgi:putative nucleotidyltransferase with HDIG domain